MKVDAETLALARQYHQAGNLPQAEQLYQRIIQTNPTNADVHHLIGLVAFQLGRFQAAVQSIGQAIELKPNSVNYYCNLGLAHEAMGQIDEAVSCYQQALRVQTDFPDAHRNLGKAFLVQGRVEEAVKHCREAVRLRPEFAAAHNSLAITLLRSGQPQEAVTHCLEALRLKPDYVEALNNLGTAQKQLGRLAEAQGSFEKALRLKPDYGVAHWNHSMMMLLNGDFERGWPEYEWRWALHSMAARRFSQPLWDGSDLDGRTILVHAEQGLGDALQFIRYLPVLKAKQSLKPGKIILECHPQLLRLLAGLPGIDLLVSRGSPLPPFDLQAPLLSLPGILRTTLATVPTSIPYIHADEKLMEHWKGAGCSVQSAECGLASTPHSALCTPHFFIGIAWQGSRERPGDHQRSIPLTHFNRFARIAGVQLISVQKGLGTEPLSKQGGVRSAEREVEESPSAALRTLYSALRTPLLDETSGPFMDTAALMRNLDLVISADTAVAHVAGALGVPVWVALPLAPDWRWLVNREDSPWYPTMRLFRQSQYAVWDDVFEHMAEELEKRYLSCRT
jgi:Flp pilus assembly protein TadD